MTWRRSAPPRCPCSSCWRGDGWCRVGRSRRPEQTHKSNSAGDPPGPQRLERSQSMTTQNVLMPDAEVARGAAEEQGFGALMTERGRLPLKALDVNARLEGLFAQTNLTQTFVNTH